MATFPTTSFGGDLLDQLSGHSTYVALYTVPPTKAGGGTELTGGGYARQAITLGSSVDGTVGRTAQRTSTGGQLFLDMPVASTSILGLAIVDDDTDEVLVVDDSWTPASTFAIGDNLLIDALTVFTEN